MLYTFQGNDVEHGVTLRPKDIRGRGHWSFGRQLLYSHASFFQGQWYLLTWVTYGSATYSLAIQHFFKMKGVYNIGMA